MATTKIDSSGVTFPDSSVQASAAASISKVIKAADQTAPNDTTLYNDTHLVLAVAANKVYEFHFIIYVTKGSDTTGNIQIAMAVPAGASGFYRLASDLIGAAAFGSVKAVAVIDAAITAIALAASNSAILTIDGIIVVAATAGSLQFKWGNSDFATTDLIFKQNSSMTLTLLS